MGQRLQRPGERVLGRAPVPDREALRVVAGRDPVPAQSVQREGASFGPGEHLDRRLLELIKIRASQLNGCAFCIDLHTREARAHGETEQRIYALSAWRETPFFTDRERAALAFIEAITLLQDGHVPDEVYAEAARHFDDAELAQLIWAAVVINAWNRVGVATRWFPASTGPPRDATSASPAERPRTRPAAGPPPGPVPGGLGREAGPSPRVRGRRARRGGEQTPICAARTVLRGWSGTGPIRSARGTRHLSPAGWGRPSS